jgi:hypothetical protein
VQYKRANETKLHWPFAIDTMQNKLNLRSPAMPYNAVFSFVVQPGDKYGWITAYSPVHQVVIGYVWKRNDYPWIHLWQHWDDGALQYRGMEFGTAGIHQPFKEILETDVALFGEKTVAYIDAGEKISKSYLCFLQEVEIDFKGVESIQIKDGFLKIQPIAKPVFTIKLTNHLLHELSV